MTTSGSKIYLYYKTPSLDYENVILVEDGVVIYAREEVFRGKRGDFDDYINKYGQSGLTLYDHSSDNPYLKWSVFLKSGVAVFHLDQKVRSVLYFVPQDEETFLNKVAKDLGLTKTPPKAYEISD